MNEWHVTDWTLEEFEHHVVQSAGHVGLEIEVEHLHQPLGSVLLTPGRDPEASFWVVVATARGGR
jgi:hypothetical protein